MEKIKRSSLLQYL